MMKTAEPLKNEPTLQNWQGLLDSLSGDDGSARLSSYRMFARERLEKTGWPDRRWESWKYMNLQPVLKASYRLPLPDQAAAPASFPEAEDRPRMLLTNGACRLSSETVPGLKLQCLETFDKEGLENFFTEAGIAEEASPFALLNAAGFQQAVLVETGKDAITPPVFLEFQTRDEDGRPLLGLPRILIRVAEGAKARLACRFTGAGQAASLTNAVCQVRLERNASLELVCSENMPDTHSLFLTVRASLAAGSRLDWTQVAQKGSLIRNDLQVDFDGEEAFCRLQGLAVLAGTSRVFNEVAVNHRKGRCISRQLFKNILADESQAEFNSLAHVFPGAQKSDSDQLNKNLLLSAAARAYARPKLKIYADDVSATHGSATGRTDEQELFYLRSRGFDPKLARFVLTYGFAEEILETIGMDGVRQALEEQVRSGLQKMMP